LEQKQERNRVDLSVAEECVASSHNVRRWQQRVGALASLPALIRQLGADCAPVLAASGLQAADLAFAENRVPYPALVEALDHAARAAACPHFGLLAGRLWTLADLGTIGRLARHSATVGRALDALTMFQHLNSEGALAFLLKRGDFVDFGYAIYHPGTLGAAQMYDANLAAGMNFMAGAGWTPYEVFLPHARPADVAQYRALFKVVPRFDAEYCALRFPAQDLVIPIDGADSVERMRAEQQARDAGPPDLLQQVYRALRRLMLENRHSGDDVAQLLAMHRRTLNRRLKSEGLTFQRVLDDVRFEVSRDLLANSDIHLDDIAATLGYAAVTPFMRTFRRWSGTTPGQWRRSARIHRADDA
jgi:AraC-like DNA-binding protein